MRLLDFLALRLFSVLVSWFSRFFVYPGSLSILINHLAWGTRHTMRFPETPVRRFTGQSGNPHVPPPPPLRFQPSEKFGEFTWMIFPRLPVSAAVGSGVSATQRRWNRERGEDVVSGRCRVGTAAGTWQDRFVARQHERGLVGPQACKEGDGNRGGHGGSVGGFGGDRCSVLEWGFVVMVTPTEPGELVCVGRGRAGGWHGRRAPVRVVAQPCHRHTHTLPP